MPCVTPRISKYPLPTTFRLDELYDCKLRAAPCERECCVYFDVTQITIFILIFPAAQAVY